MNAAHLPLDASPPRKWRVIKLLGSLLFYGATESLRALRTALGRAPERAWVVIYYHQVLRADRERFARQMDHLVRWARAIAPDLRLQFQGPGRCVVVTADDGWKSFEENALPELRRRNIPVTLFAISGRLGESIDNIKGDRIVSEAELREFAKADVTIGSHTASHVALTKVSLEDASRELVASREQLSKIVGAPIRLFCFPYGECNEELIDLARRAGYERVFTGMPYLARPQEFVLGRVRVDPSDWLLEFHLKLMGAYRWLPAAILLKGKLAARLPAPAKVIASLRLRPS